MREAASIQPHNTNRTKQVHRRTFHDDGRGVAEPLDEPGQFGDGLIIRGRHYVVVDTIAASQHLHRTLGQLFMLRPHPLFMVEQSDPAAYKTRFLTNVKYEPSLNFNLLMIPSLNCGRCCALL